MMDKQQGLMKRLLMILAAAGMACASAHGGIGDWKNFTAMNSIRAVASSHDSVWAATSGGAFLYTLHDSSFVRFTNSDGLTTNDLTAIAIDKAGAVWFGQSNGSVDVYSPAAGRWRYIRDIAVADKAQKAIMSFYPAGDSMYIATAFGVSLFSIPRFEFIDTYGNFGASVPPPVLSVVMSQNRVYAATAKGIAVSKANAVNLAAPESWDTYTALGSPATLALFNGAVVAGTDQGMFTFNGTSSWIPVAAAGQPVEFTGQSASALYFTRSNTIFSYAANGAVSVLGTQLRANVTSGTVATGIPIVGTDLLGLAQWNAASAKWSTSAPNGPASNKFTSLAVDENGVVWAASGRAYGVGFYSYDGSQWTNYSKATFPGLRSDSCFGVVIGPNNSKWISTWGGGLVLLNSAGKFVRRYDDVSPGFIGVNNDIHYTVPAIPAFSADGSVWTSIFRSANLSQTVWKMKPDSTWVSFSAPPGAYNDMLGVTVDRNDTKWFINQLPGFPAGQKIVYLRPGTNENWGTFSDADGATSNAITSVVEDREGIIWIGTSAGITIINNESSPLTGMSKVFLGAIRDQYINCITVDALNNKWVGMATGVLVLSPDGTSLLDQYTVDNSNGKLVDNNVYSIAFDSKKGVAYFGTENGLSSVGITTIAPAADYSGISAAPNPFYPGQQPYVMIQGLADGSTVKILTVSGKLVKQFSAQGGGRAFWDGRTESGETVASGIYLAVAYDIGSRVGRVKLAVIRR
jgi:hypothetical protein